MIGMNFIAFATLFFISVIVAFVMHYVVRYRLRAGVEGFLVKLVAGWLGGWLGSPVFGYWPATWKLESVYVVPAVLGSVVAVFGAVLVLRTLSSLVGASTVGTPRAGREGEGHLLRDVA
jgi:uncharacterized membrane protein YeaQ/YmgE (transglycosylase-associated protein family)